jgi:hypothetical protein
VAYLRRNFHIEVSDINKILQKISLMPSDEKDKLASLLCKSCDLSSLEPIKYLSGALQTQPNEELFVREQFLTKIKDHPFLVAVVIPIVVALIQALLST